MEICRFCVKIVRDTITTWFRYDIYKYTPYDTKGNYITYIFLQEQKKKKDRKID